MIGAIGVSSPVQVIRFQPTSSATSRGGGGAGVKRSADPPASGPSPPAISTRPSDRRVALCRLRTTATGVRKSDCPRPAGK